MTERFQTIVSRLQAHLPLMMQAERYLYAHPQTGYTEWEAHAYLKERFEEMGYTLRLASDVPGFGPIPGFTAEADTGRPGPTVALFAEMDALDIAAHPDAVNGMVHACGHHAQCAAMLGVAAVLKEKDILEGLCGKIRLIVVPAEEMIQLGMREQLRKDGVIGYYEGKVEFMRRGLLDGVDMALMMHALSSSLPDFWAVSSMNGMMPKSVRYKGKAAHAGGAPQSGINAQYAAMLGLQAVNDLRETFPDEDSVRFHPIMLGVTSAVNVIPDEMRVESYVRGRTLDVMKRENGKINRALAAGALAIGAGIEITDRPGALPERDDEAFMRLVEDCCKALVGENRVAFSYGGREKGSSDFGDVTAVMPGVQLYCSGASGGAHTVDYKIADAKKLCLNGASALVCVVRTLLEDGAAKAKAIIGNYKPQFASIKDYFAAVDELFLDKDAVTYGDDGKITVDLSK